MNGIGKYIRHMTVTSVSRNDDPSPQPRSAKYGRFAPAFCGFLLLLLAPATGLLAQGTILQQGEELFLNNKPEEALPLLESALRQYPNNGRIYLYLGTIYEQLGQSERAVRILQRGSEVTDEDVDVMYYNIANNLFAQGKNALAIEMFSRAVESNPEMAGAYLNRANTRLKLEQHGAALEDYILYLSLRPMSPQRDAIEKVIGLLREIVEEEFAKQQAQEASRKAEADRQKALLDEVLNSLKRAAEATKNIASESEDIEEVKEKSDIVD